MLHIVQQWGAIVVGIFAAISIVVGAHITLRPTTDTQQTVAVTRLFAFGTGAFFTAVCLDFLPDAWSAAGDKTPYWLFLGALVMWIATHLSDSVFDHDQKLVSCSADAREHFAEEPLWNTTLKFTPVSAIVLAAALSFHTFLEGAAVSLSFHDLSWNTLGFSLAMILHKLPEGVLWGLALATVFPSDRSKIKRILIIPAVCTIAGVFLGIFLADQASSQVINVATGFVAGAMFYIAFAELLPTLRESTRPRLTRSWFVIGLTVMFILNSLSSIFGG